MEPWLTDWFGCFPLFSGYPSNQGVLPACVVLSIMVVPIVASISRELFLSVPSELKQGAMALGATRWEMVRSVMLPYVSAGWWPRPCSASAAPWARRSRSPR